MADQSYSSSTGSIMFSAAVPVEANLAAAAVVGIRCAGSRRYTLSRVSVVISDDITSTGSIVLTAYRWKTPDSDAGAVSIGTITVSADGEAGDLYVREFSSDIQPGEAVAVKVTTQAAGAGAAANAVVHIEGYESDVTLPDCPAGATTSAGADKADAGVGQLFRVKA